MGTDTCDQICINNPGSYHCSCNTGYSIKSNGISCMGKLIRHNNFLSYENTIDIDECQIGNDTCEHTCHNTIGSFYCECNSGYRLDIQTNSTCNGKFKLNERFHCIDFDRY